jgi:hypothetical protein
MNQCGDQLEALRRRARELDRKIGNCVAAIAKGLNSPAATAEIRDLKQQLAGIHEKLIGAQPAAVNVRMRDTRQFVDSRLRELQVLFNAEPQTVRAEIAKHVRKITLTAEGKSYIAEGNWSLLEFGSTDGAGGGKWTERMVVPFGWLAAA